jgi:hypothetical protein
MMNLVLPLFIVNAFKLILFKIKSITYPVTFLFIFQNLILFVLMRKEEDIKII